MLASFLRHSRVLINATLNERGIVVWGYAVMHYITSGRFSLTAPLLSLLIIRVRQFEVLHIIYHLLLYCNVMLDGVSAVTCEFIKVVLSAGGTCRGELRVN